MMYFLVEKHNANSHLLDSGMFDAIGEIDSCYLLS
jgi:hypothetical protein